MVRITLPETNSKFAPENRPKRPQKETRKYSNHPFSGALAVSFREGTPIYFSHEVQVIWVLGSHNWILGGRKRTDHYGGLNYLRDVRPGIDPPVVQSECFFVTI